MLQNDQGEWVAEGGALKDMATEFYRESFTSDGATRCEFTTGCFPPLEVGEAEELGKEVTMEETRRALDHMGSYKAPGPDGFQAVFFKRTWDITGEAVYSFVRNALREGDVPEEAAMATLVLIPKEPTPSSIRGFRPLSLCNVSCKLVSKVIVNRLKAVMEGLISPCQASFVPGRQGLDNVIICQEFVHSLRFMKAKKGAAIIKVDLEKACDRLEWAFIQETLQDVGIPSKLIDVIMQLLNRGTCKLLWNGEETDVIKPSRGLRQGDPLSPYLFVLCLERLGHWLGKRVEDGSLRPVKASRSGPGLSYLFFADDLILFSEAVEEQLLCLKEGLDLFCRASGQRVSYAKSSILFSASVHIEEARRLSGLIGIPLTDCLGKYLGHHVLHKGRNGAGHRALVDKVRSKLEGWKAKCLSRASRLTLAQSTLMSIPIFHMQLEQLPAWVHKALDKAVRCCIWRGQGGKRDVHLLKWETLLKPKEQGGANIKSAREMNWALLAKLAWRIMAGDGEIWSNVIRAKYGVKESDGAHFRGRQRASQVWKGAIWGAELLRQGMVWEVSNGETVRFWKEVWVGRKPFIEQVGAAVDQEHVDCRVAHYWQWGRGWKWHELQFLPATSMVLLASKALRNEGGDTFTWLKADGKGFSVKTAYGIASGFTEVLAGKDGAYCGV